jgi:hypothetical protein
VRITVDVDVSDVWGGDCPMSQVNAQARTSALNRVRAAFLFDERFEQPLLPSTQVRVPWALVGGPAVTAILTEEKP